MSLCLDTKPVTAAAGVDVQDVLLVLGVLFGEAAAIVIWWPAALILGMLFCFTFVVLIQMSRAKEGSQSGPDRS